MFSIFFLSECYMDTTNIVQVAMILIFMWFCFMEIRNGCVPGKIQTTSMPAIHTNISPPRASLISQLNFPDLSTTHIAMFAFAALVGIGIAYMYQKYRNNTESFEAVSSNEYTNIEDGFKTKNKNRPRRKKRRRRSRSTPTKLKNVSSFNEFDDSDDDNEDDEDDDELHLGRNSGRNFYSFVDPKEIKRMMKSYQPGKCKPHGKKCPPCPQYAEVNPVGFLTNKGWSQKSIMYDDFTDKYFD